MSNYYVIYASDGDTYVKVFDRVELEKYLGDITDDVKPEYLPQFPPSLPDEANTQYWPDNTVLIIKGEIIVPQKREVIVKYAVE